MQKSQDEFYVRLMIKLIQNNSRKIRNNNNIHHKKEARKTRAKFSKER
jgi:hypothetical protein